MMVTHISGTGIDPNWEPPPINKEKDLQELEEDMARIQQQYEVEKERIEDGGRLEGYWYE